MKSSKSPSWWPWALAVCMAVWALSSLFHKPEPGLHVREFGRLPVLLNGRVQPFDSVARNSLLQIRGKQTAPMRLHFSIWDPQKRGKIMPAMDWLLEVMFKPSVADTRKVFRIDHPDLTTLLKLPAANPEAGEDGKHFSFNQIQPSMAELQRQARAASEREAVKREPFERQTLKLWNAVSLYRQLKNSVKPEAMHDLQAEIERLRPALAPGALALQARQAGGAFNQEDLDNVVQLIHGFEPTAQMAYPLIIPPADPATSRDTWENLGIAVLSAVRSGTLHPAIEFYANLAKAYHDDQVERFNQTLASYTSWLGRDFQRELGKATAETRFNLFQPFYRALVIDVLSFLLICAYWVRLSENLRRAAVWLLVVGFVIHSGGLLYRMVLEGRPPVTNLYSSAIFIGWGSALLGLLVERIHRIGIGAASGAFVGFVTLIIAHNLGVGGDTMEMMRAVLDSNFWLATHVVTITIGYSAMFLAGFFGILLLVLAPFTRVLNPDSIKAVGRLIYGIICFATFFSFIGTILGGIWADQSWGRFWGWDPKENGALLIVLWCAVMLHARWGGLVRDRGLAAMAVFGNIITSFSWFGVNMLGVGLHSYGFMDSAFKWLALFIVSQLGIMALGLIPPEAWLTRRSSSPAKPRTRSARA